MIITKKVKLRITNSNKKYLESKGYFGSLKDDIEIDVNHLSVGSHSIIEVCCDVCGKSKFIIYKQYLNSFKKYNYYTCSSKCASGKNKKTCLDKYGVDSFTKTDEYKEKFEATCLEKFGTKNPLLSEDVKDKIKTTMFERYGVYHNTESSVVIDNRKINTLTKYGVEHTTQLDTVKEKIKTVIKEKYGVENVTQLDWVKEKIKNTCLVKYNSNSPMQKLEIFEKQQKNGYYIKNHLKTGLYYRGTYELDFLNFCVKYNLDVKKGLVFNFIYNGKNKYYYSDFFIPKYNLIVEIKSDYYYEKYKQINEKKKEAVIESNYDFIFIINKKYVEFLKKIKL
jgi:hypothetical protein